MTDYRVNIDVFAGPLDLLLYLVRKNELDIYDIPVADVTDQYIRYIEMLKKIDIDVAGDFLVTAATLVHIKSVMLLPVSEEQEDGEEDAGDPRAELVRQLLEYKKFKDAANMLAATAEEHGLRFGRPPVITEMLKEDREREMDIEQVSIWTLLEAFDNVMKATGGGVYDISSIHDDTPIDLYQIEILNTLQTEGPQTFTRLFDRKAGRVVMIGLFLAILELVKEKLATADQAGAGQEIYLRAITDQPAEEAVRKAIAASDDNEKPLNSERPPIPIAEIQGAPEPETQQDVEELNVPVPILEITAGCAKTDGQKQSDATTESQIEPAGGVAE